MRCSEASINLFIDVIHASHHPCDGVIHQAVPHFIERRIQVFPNLRFHLRPIALVRDSAETGHTQGNRQACDTADRRRRNACTATEGEFGHQCFSRLFGHRQQTVARRPRSGAIGGLAAAGNQCRIGGETGNRVSMDKLVKRSTVWGRRVLRN